MTMANIQFKHILLSWVCTCRKFNMHNILVFALDPDLQVRRRVRA